MEKGISAAIDELPNDALIKPFLMANKAEVTRMCITEYDEERTYAEMREEAIEEGLAQGMAQGMEKGTEKGAVDMLVKLVTKGILTVAQAANELGITVSEFQAKAGMTA